MGKTALTGGSTCSRTPRGRHGSMARMQQPSEPRAVKSDDVCEVTWVSPRPQQPGFASADDVDFVALFTSSKDGQVSTAENGECYEPQTPPLLKLWLSSPPAQRDASERRETTTPVRGRMFSRRGVRTRQRALHQVIAILDSSKQQPEESTACTVSESAEKLSDDNLPVDSPAYNTRSQVVRGDGVLPCGTCQSPRLPVVGQSPSVTEAGNKSSEDLWTDDDPDDSVILATQQIIAECQRQTRASKSPRLHSGLAALQASASATVTPKGAKQTRFATSTPVVSSAGSSARSSSSAVTQKSVCGPQQCAVSTTRMSSVPVSGVAPIDELDSFEDLPEPEILALLDKTDFVVTQTSVCVTRPVSSFCVKSLPSLSLQGCPQSRAVSTLSTTVSGTVYGNRPICTTTSHSSSSHSGAHNISSSAPMITRTASNSKLTLLAFSNDAQNKNVTASAAKRSDLDTKRSDLDTLQSGTDSKFVTRSCVARVPASQGTPGGTSSQSSQVECVGPSQKCTAEEIARKRRLALAKRLQRKFVTQSK